MAKEKKKEAAVAEIEYELDAEGNQVLDADGNPIPKKKKSKKKLIIIIAAVVLLAGGGGGAFMLMGGDKKTAKDAKGSKEKKAEEKTAEPVYMAMPDIVVNLSSTSRRTNYINLKLTLELNSTEDVAAIEAQMPRIIDAFNTYLRELRREDLQGSAGVYRLENELMLRLQKTLTKGKVNDILFREIIIQ